MASKWPLGRGPSSAAMPADLRLRSRARLPEIFASVPTLSAVARDGMANTQSARGITPV